MVLQSHLGGKKYGESSFCLNFPMVGYFFPEINSQVIAFKALSRDLGINRPSLLYNNEGVCNTRNI